MHHPFFYDKPVLADHEQRYINKLLKKYRDEPPTEVLKQKIWDELQEEKNAGRITIPFKLAHRKDPDGKYPPFIEVILDTKL